VAAKRQAAKRWGDDRVAYTEAKDGAISELLAEAEIWVGG